MLAPCESIGKVVASIAYPSNDRNWEIVMRYDKSVLTIIADRVPSETCKSACLGRILDVMTKASLMMLAASITLVMLLGSAVIWSCKEMKMSSES